MAQPPKRKLCTLGRSSNVAPAVLAKLLEDIGDELPAHCSRSTIMRARTEAIENISTPYGKLMQDVGLTTKYGSFFHVLTLTRKPHCITLYLNAHRSPGVWGLLGRRTNQAHPTSGPSHYTPTRWYRGMFCQWTTKENSKLFTGRFCSWARLLYHRKIFG